MSDHNIIQNFYKTHGFDENGKRPKGESMSDNLKPCPFCGRDDHTAYAENIGKGHYIHCYWCVMDGPFKDTRDLAAEAWNTRKVIDD